jgi:DNA end-binding protein Ku
MRAAGARCGATHTARRLRVRVLEMRAMWKASVELGKLHIPVKLYGAVEERKVHFRLLHAKDRVPVMQRMVDPRTQEEVPAEEIRRGVELEPGVFVVVDPDELESAQPEPSRSIEVTRVIPRDALDIAWFERPYYLGPDGSNDDYFALAAVLAESEQVGIARWVMRGKQYFGALAPHGRHLALIALRAADEVVTPDSLAHPRVLRSPRPSGSSASSSWPHSQENSIRASCATNIASVSRS